MLKGQCRRQRCGGEKGGDKNVLRENGGILVVR